MKHKQIIFLLTASLLLTGCDSSRIYEQSDILLVTSGYQYEGEYHNDIYRELVETYEHNKYNVNLELYDLGNDRTSYAERFLEQVSSKEYDYIVVLGDDLSPYVENTIKTYQGYKFIYFDNESSEKYVNTISLNFTPEDLGGLFAKKASSLNKTDISYFYSYQNSFANRRLYGMLSTLDKENKDYKVAPYNIEEDYNQVKVESYVNKAKTNNHSSLFIEDVKGNLPYMKNVLNDDEIVVTSYFELVKQESNYIYRDFNKMFKYMHKNIAENSFDFSSNIELGIKEGYLSANKIDINIDVDKYDSTKEQQFETLKDKYLIDVASQYDVSETVYGKYHEALPNCGEWNDWKHNPRPGGDCMKPADWKSLGIWSTIYAQDGMRRSANTGIEFKNMKIYGYSSRRGWVFLEHANPTGSFYDENFVNDYNKYFEGRIYNDQDNKTTKILLDKETTGFNYHPFGSQIDLSGLDMVDIEYVYSTLDIRLITWNESKDIDIEDAKYVANIGGDWWVEQGATWKPDWSANRDVAVGQFRTITKEWKTLEMCSCPVEKMAQILVNKEFLD